MANDSLYYCMDNNSADTNYPCKEEYFCSELPKLENNKECSYYSLSVNSYETHISIPDELNKKSKEDYKCYKVPKILEEGLELNSCSYYSVSNNSLFIRINDTSIDSNYLCREEYLCNQVPNDIKGCRPFSYFPVTNESL